MVALLDAQPSMTKECVQVNPLPVQNLETEENMPSIIQPPELELQRLPKHLRYAFIENSNTFPIIISISLTYLQEGKLLRILMKHKLFMG